MSLGRRTGSESHVLTASGRIRSRTESIDKWITVTDPPRYFGEALRAALVEEGVGIDGATVEVAGLPEVGWRSVHVHRTGLLPVLEILNKRSQNFYAESLLKLLGARLCDEGSWAAGHRVVADFLAEIGIEPGTYSLIDGSGMSRGNRLTPRQMTLVLRHMFYHPWGGEFVRTLPYSGEVDLRWEKRLADPPYRGNVMAKTGYLNGVSTLSGYAKARSGKLYAFALLMNSIRTKNAAEAAQDKIVRAVVDHG
jgi:D-alanyl-D-alanine carboxypeptidase/D-alanyl-D-alanine-endopeptidase (penicillin-binding protein 4)